MSLESQLLSIIEQQQQQLQDALQRLEAQSYTIEQLEQYAQNLKQFNETAISRIKQQEEIINKLRNPQLPETLLLKLQGDIQQQLQQHLVKLVGQLNIEQQITKALPRLTQTEIEKQLEPLTKQVIEKIASAEQYQRGLRDLIQTLSTKL
jgi:soluble cytochrome b562